MVNALQFQFATLIAALTSRVGRCETRDLDQTSLSDTAKLKAVGAIMEHARKHYASLPNTFTHPISKVTWEIDARDPRSITVATSVGHFKFAAEGEDVRCAKSQPYYYYGRY